MFTDIRFGTELLAGIAYLVSSMLLIKFACDMFFFLERNDDVMSLKHTILSWLGGVPRSKVIFLTAERDYAREQVEEYKKDLVAAREVIEQLRDKIKSTQLTSNH